MIELSHTALSIWGGWVMSFKLSGQPSVTFRYDKKTNLGGDAEANDQLGLIIDGIVATMPDDMELTRRALKQKYMFNRIAHVASQYLHVGQSTYRVIVKEGLLWVESHLTCIHNRPDCPGEIKDLFIYVESEIKEKSEKSLPNGPIQHRAGRK